jgi:hypothetical protein
MKQDADGMKGGTGGMKKKPKNKFDGFAQKS